MQRNGFPLSQFPQRLRCQSVEIAFPDFGREALVHRTRRFGIDLRRKSQSFVIRQFSDFLHQFGDARGIKFYCTHTATRSLHSLNVEPVLNRQAP